MNKKTFLLVLFSLFLSSCVEEAAQYSFSGEYELISVTYSGLGSDKDVTTEIQSLNEHPNYPFNTNIPKKIEVIQGIMPFISLLSEEEYYLEGNVFNDFIFQFKIAGFDEETGEWGYFAQDSSLYFDHKYSFKRTPPRESYVESIPEDERLNLGFNPKWYYDVYTEQVIEFFPRPATAFKPIYFGCSLAGCHKTGYDWATQDLPLTEGAIEEWQKQDKIITIRQIAAIVPKSPRVKTWGEGEHSYRVVLTAKYKKVYHKEHGNLRGKPRKEAEKELKDGELKNSELETNYRNFFKNKKGRNFKYDFLQTPRSLEGLFLVLYYSVYLETGRNPLGFDLEGI